MTIHDLLYRVVPDAHFGLKGLGMRVLVPLAARTSDRVIAISQSTAADVQRRRGHRGQTTSQLGSRRPTSVAAIALRQKIHLLRERMFFMGCLLLRRDSRFVSGFLDGLKGIEIGAASHNDYRLDAINVDRYAEADTIYKDQERRLVLRTAKVDVVACGDDLPFEDDSHDFVFSSHVLEHIPDPIRALLEWQRVARRYVVCVIPHKERTFDVDRPLTTTEELLGRHRAGLRSEEDKHWSVWTCESFLELCDAIGLEVVGHLDPDDKVRNGFVVAIDATVRPPPLDGDSSVGAADGRTGQLA